MSELSLAFPSAREPKRKTWVQPVSLDFYSSMDIFLIGFGKLNLHWLISLSLTFSLAGLYHVWKMRSIGCQLCPVPHGCNPAHFSRKPVMVYVW